MPSETKETTVTVRQIRFLTIGGESYIYLKGSDGVFYKLAVADDESVLLIDEESKLTVEYTDTETNEKIKNIVSWSFSEVLS